MRPRQCRRTTAAVSASNSVIRRRPTPGARSSARCSRTYTNDPSYVRGTCRMPALPLCNDRAALRLTPSRIVDALPLQNLPVCLAFDRARGKYQPGQIPRRVSAEPRRRGELSDCSEHSSTAGRNEHAACSLPSASATCRPGVYRRPKEKPTPPRGMVSGGSLISAFGIKRAIRGFDTLEALGGFRDRPSNREIIGLAFDY